MPYDEYIAERVRSVLRDFQAVTEKKMFGGIAFMLHGNMVCGVRHSELMVRLGNEGVADALRQPHTRPMDLTGRNIKSMMFVEEPGLESDAQIEHWVNRAAAFAQTLPPK